VKILILLFCILGLLSCSDSSNPGDGLDPRGSSTTAFIVTEGDSCFCAEIIAASTECTLKAPRLTIKNFRLHWNKPKVNFEIIAVVLKYSVSGTTNSYQLSDDEIKASITPPNQKGPNDFVNANTSICSGLKFGSLAIPTSKGPFSIPGRLVVKGLLTTDAGDESTGFIEHEVTINGEIF
jgi:hypothetical protein